MTNELFVASGNGCDEADYPGIVEGHIALITLGDASTSMEAHLTAYIAKAVGKLSGLRRALAPRRPSCTHIARSRPVMGQVG
jgi:hypothetical protein